MRPPSSSYRLSPYDRALWRQVTATVTPHAGRRATPDERNDPTPAPAVPPRPVVQSPAPSTRSTPAAAVRPVMDAGLDDAWDRRLAKGQVAIDRVLDLHGHSVGVAHQMLIRMLGDMVQHRQRVLLLITGKPRQIAHGERIGARGTIRREVADWLALSPYADRIASVRGAAPRHGGAGALYVILRRR